MVALIPRDSADELGLALGQQVAALIKATDVMLMNDESAPSPTVGMIGG